MGQYDKVKWRGGYLLTRRQRQALIAAEKAIQERYKNFEFIMIQGSWRPRTEYSGTSHCGAGVVDLGYAGMSWNTRSDQDKYRFVLRKLREVGKQAAFGRGPWNKQIDGTGVMPLHFHTCDIDTTGSYASWQVGEYKKGNNGLYAGVKDKFRYHPKPIHKWRYKP